MQNRHLMFAVLLLTGATAQAQPARIGNVWNGEAHQPSAGPEQNREGQAGVAPDDQTARRQQDDLDRMGRQLMDRAGADAKASGTTNTYGVDSGNATPATPPSPSDGTPSTR